MKRRNLDVRSLAAGASLLVLALAGSAQAQERAFDVPAQAASRSIPEFARQAGVQIVAPADQLRGLTTPAISGNLDARAALQTLIARTGLVVASDNGSVIILSAGAKPELQRASSLEEVLVTARKREESLLDIPVAVTAFTSAKVEATGVANLQDLSKFTPGLDVQNQGGGIAGRYIAGIRFRGMNPSRLSPSFQVGALFVDGIYYLGGAQSLTFDDIERVEVIRGPQAAYFGRSTFGGAINYITRDPSSQFKGKAGAGYASRGDFDGNFSIEGPIFQDSVTGRLSASVHKKGSDYTATDGGALGEERTTAITGTLLFRPTEKLKIKVRGSYSRDDDGPPNATVFSFTKNGNCRIGTPIQFKNTLGGAQNGVISTANHCGAIPFSGVLVSSNTRFPSAPFPFAAITGGPPLSATLDVRDVLVNNSFNSPLLAKAPSLDHIGLIRNAFRLSAAGDYEISPSLTLSGNIAYNQQDANTIRDGDYSDATLVFVAAPYKFKDASGEVRLRYDNNGPLRALIGVNHYRQRVNAIYGNGVEATFGFQFGAGAITRPNPLSNSGGNFDRISTTGLFGSVDYDILSNLTLTLEGRYQKDTVERFGGNQLTGIVVLPDSLESKGFLPRVILRWKPIQTSTIYASYSRGVLPGDINSVVGSLVAVDIQAARDLLGASVVGSVPEETLKSYEIGYKQSALEGRLNFSVTGYYMEWNNQKSSATVFLPVNRNTGFTIVGDSELKGVELEANWRPVDALELSGSFSATDGRYTDFAIPGNGPAFGVNTNVGYNAKDNRLPRYPLSSGAFSATYTQPYLESSEWYVRGDLIYQGKQYLDETNLNWVSPYTLVNARIGINNFRSLRVEVYAENLFDKRGWVTGSGAPDLSYAPLPLEFAPGVTPATVLLRKGATLTPLDRRTVGIRASYEF